MASDNPVRPAVGIALDAEIARRCFGWTTDAEGWWHHPDTGGAYSNLPWAFSTEVKHGWQVFVWLLETAGQASVYSDMEAIDGRGHVFASCCTNGEDGLRTLRPRPMPEAVCLLALDYLDHVEKEDGNER